MSLMDLHCVQIHCTADDTAVKIGGITKQAIKVETEAKGEAVSGAVHPKLASIYSQKPTASFTSYALTSVLNRVTQIGSLIDADETHPGVTLYGQVYAAGGHRATGSSHRSYNIKRGVIVPKTLSCEHRGDATIDCDILATYDGTNAPVIPADSQALPESVTDPGRWTLYSLQLGDVTLGSWRNLEIDFGMEVESEGYGSEPFDRLLRIVRIEPKLTVRGIDPAWFAAADAVDLDGLSGTHANCSIKLAHRATGGKFVAVGTETHITCTCAGVLFVDDIQDVEHGGAAEVSLGMQLYHDGTNNPFVFATTAALT